MGISTVKYLLDTHVWIWWHMSPEHLSARVRNTLLETSGYDELLISVISPWEFAKLLEKGRLAISCDPELWIRVALHLPKLRIVNLKPEIAYRSTILPRPFHGDPADQIIVASAREENAVILTKDERILNYQHVKSLW